jgi:tripeptide aminopeptidase
MFIGPLHGKIPSSLKQAISYLALKIAAMFQTDYAYTVVERFMRYVQVDTQSDPQSNTHPTTAKQKNLSAMLLMELKEMGLQDAEMDHYGYVYATIPANTDKAVPVVCFCSHVDTAPDCSGTGVAPILHTAYDGHPITLPDDATQVLSIEKYPYLKEHIGKDIITASGTTLLGADDKSGVAIIMDMAYYLLQHPDVKHGAIRLLFTPDEEVGRGTAKLDMEKLGATIGYTLDGGEAGSLEEETFSADGFQIVVNGVIAHPGYAKGKLVNALKIAGEILAALPKEEWSPETTSGKQGFVHPVRIEGIAEQATIDFIIRDFETANLARHEQRLQAIAEQVVAAHPGATATYTAQEQYRNMKEVLQHHPKITEYARQAITEAGLPVKMESIRGGTDGSRLSFMGLPCPNLFTGMHGIHSKTEWVGVADMHKAVEVLVRLVQIWERES